MYGAAAAKSQKDRAPCSCSIVEIATVSETMPVTLEAAENEPIFSGRSAYARSAARSASRSMWPSASCGITTTSAIDSRHGISLEWCSKGPMNTTGRSCSGMCRSSECRSSSAEGMRSPSTPISLEIAPVRARPGEDDDRLVVAADGLVDDPAGVLAQAGGLQAGAARLGVGVRVARQHLVADEVLDERQRPARRGVVGVGDPAFAVRRAHDVVLADHGVPDQPHQGRLSRHCSSSSTQATRRRPAGAPRCCAPRPRRSSPRC